MRPDVRVPYRWWDLAILLCGAAFALASVVYTAVAWHRLPAVVPSHFTLNGRANQTGGRGTLLALPAMSVLFVVGAALLGRIPRSFNYPAPVTRENAPRLYGAGRAVMEVLLGLDAPLMLLAVQISLIRNALEPGVGLGPVVVGLSLAPMVVTVVWGVGAMARRARA